MRRDTGLRVHHFDTPPVELPLHREFALLDPGQGLKRALRYALATAPVSYLTETKLTSRRLAGGMWGPPQAMPVMKNGLAITTSAPASSLAARILPAEIIGTSTPEAIQYLSSWKAIEGRRLSIEVDTRGRLGAVAFSDDPDSKRSATERDELVQRLLATLVPLPDEPIGVGAKWRVVTVLRQRPAIVKQTATYTLRSLTDKAWMIDVDIRRVGEAQRLLEPELPKNVAVELVALIRVMQGSLSIEPSLALPVGKLDVTSTIHIRATTPKAGNSEEIVEDTGTILLTVAR